MKIRMYNCYFGDCFRIEGLEKSMYVDFGIHPCSLADYKRGNPDKMKIERKNEIMEDILEEKVLPDFLLTHYHLDHYSGLLHMINYYRSHPLIKKIIFDKFYIPDIWNVADLSVVSLHIIEELLRNCRLSKEKRSYSLYELIGFFTTDVNSVQFVRRGTEINSVMEFQALWPNKDIARGKLVFFLEKKGLVDSSFHKSLVELTENLKMLVLEKSSGIKEIVQATDRLLDEHMEEIRSMEDDNLKENVDCVYLNSMGNRVSIVFQNKKSGQNNILFTGDIEDAQMKKIEADTEYPIHKSFYYIKIPHHGTDNTYHDFKGYKPKVIMIPNGMCKDDTYKISGRYVRDFGGIGTKVYCANTNWCTSNTTGAKTKCSCRSMDRVYHKPFLEV